MKLFQSFWNWYEQHKVFTVGIAAFLFAIQLVHLYWLSADVVLFYLLEKSFFNPQGFWLALLLLVDYTEIPAFIATSLMYINQWRQKRNFKSIIFLFFISSQFLHIFWITDEFVIETLTHAARETILPFWLAWLAIFIDYLELPVIIETTREFFKALKERGLRPAFETFKKKD